MKDGVNSHSSLSSSSRPEKALWYQEVLSLDPQSRLFLPYARFLAGCGARSEAVQTLKAGLAQHPEFLEARLLLIQLLHEAGENESAERECTGIIEQLSQCPALWELWSRRPGVRPDQAAMLLFLGSSLSSQGLGFAEVLHAGLEALASGNTEQKPPAQEKAPAPVPAEKESSREKANLGDNAAEHAFVMSEDTPWYSLDSVPEDDEVFNEESPLPNLRPALEQISEEAAAPEISPAPHTVPRDAVTGKSSLQTRSMASILEEQGAYAEAADIYRELLSLCSTEEERSELLAKLESLDLRAVSSALPATDNSAITAMLENLAARLEQKARA